MPIDEISLNVMDPGPDEGRDHWGWSKDGRLFIQCRYCKSKRGVKWMGQGTDAEVQAWWAAHVKSSIHKKSLRDRELAQRVADALKGP